MNTIRLQNIQGYLYPADSVSAGKLEAEFFLDRIPCAKFWLWSPKIVKRGYSMAISGNTDDIV